MLCGSVRMKIEFAGVESRTFEPLPTGSHPAKCTGAQYNEASARSGEPTIAWQFTVEGGEYDGRKAFLNTSLQPQSLWSTQRVMVALGKTKEEVDALNWDTEDPDKIQADLDEMLEADCVIVIGHERFEGEKRQRVRRVLAPKEE
jgi:hypothetical protein